VTGLLVRPLLSGVKGADDDANVTVFKDQLAEIDSDLARGVLNASEAEGLRVEVSRRLLAASGSSQIQEGPAPRTATQVGLALVAVMVLGGGFATYTYIGAPALPDQPLALRLAENAKQYAERPSQVEMSTELASAGQLPPVPEVPTDQAELMERLSVILQGRPDDLAGHQLLATNLARLQNWPAAAEAQRDVLRISAAEATADEHADLAEYLILSVNGYVSPEAEAALRNSLERDARNPRARYYSGLSAIQAGRADLAYELWTRLLAESRPEAPWVLAINAQIREVALAAGRPVPPGPTAADIEAAQDMSPDEQMEMIRGMVSGLSDRLATEGGSSEEWARLIRAYGVLGERAQASRIWNEAQDTFADSPADLSIIRQAARDAEVSQ